MRRAALGQATDRPQTEAARQSGDRRWRSAGGTLETRPAHTAALPMQHDVTRPRAASALASAPHRHLHSTDTGNASLQVGRRPLAHRALRRAPVAHRRLCSCSYPVPVAAAALHMCMHGVPRPPSPLEASLHCPFAAPGRMPLLGSPLHPPFSRPPSINWPVYSSSGPFWPGMGRRPAPCDDHY